MEFACIREICCAANKRLPATGLVDLTFGNLSVFDAAAGVFAIKPSGVDYDQLRPEDIVVLDLDGNRVCGSLRPSSDTPTHRYLLRHWGSKGIGAVVHTHSRNAVAFAQAVRPIPCFGTTHADYFDGPVPLTRDLQGDEIVGDYEWATGAVLVEALATRDPRHCPAALVRHHGPFAWGADADKAIEVAIALETIARMAWQTLSLSPQALPIPQVLHHKHFHRKHGPSAYYGQG